MTILVGVLCDHGVVIGVDSSATLAIDRNTYTIEHPVKKVFIVNDDLIFATSGPDGHTQRFASIIRQLRADPTFSAGNCFDIVKTISKVTIEDFSVTHTPKGEFSALVAFTCSNQFYLCEFDLQPTFKTDDIWFVSMGSGQTIVDPFLGFLSRVFFQHSKPKLSEGIFIVLWTLRHAIEVNPGGIKGPSQIAVLTRKASTDPFTAHLYSQDELAEHYAGIDAAEQHLATYRGKLSGHEELTPL
jgi:20S proteasome alpha/beta subunit